MDFVGFWVDYSRFEIGMSEKRVAWLVSFMASQLRGRTSFE